MGHYDSCRVDEVRPYAETARRVVEARSGGRVERCHGVPHVGSYNNAAHSWGVAMLMHYLWPEDFPRLALACLSHDVPERLVGDIPAPSLRHIPGLREGIGGLEARINISLGLPAEAELSEEDHSKLKACDHLELWIWSNEQLLLGNKFAEECIIALEDLWSSRPLPKEAEALRKELKKSGFLPERSGVMIQRVLS